MEQDGQLEEEAISKGRLETLIDGIFAISLTLLVLTLNVPSGHGATQVPVASTLIGLFPDFVHYFMAFLILAAFWDGHHRQFKLIRLIDRRMLWISVAFLMFVALIPFSTSLAGEYSDSPLAAIVFELNLIVIGFINYVQWTYASNGHRLIGSELSQERVGLFKKRSMVIPALGCVGIVLALAGSTWSTTVFLLAPLVLALVGRRGSH